MSKPQITVHKLSKLQNILRRVKIFFHYLFLKIFLPFNLIVLVFVLTAIKIFVKFQNLIRVNSKQQLKKQHNCKLFIKGPAWFVMCNMCVLGLGLGLWVDPAVIFTRPFFKSTPSISVPNQRKQNRGGPGIGMV